MRVLKQFVLLGLVALMLGGCPRGENLPVTNIPGGSNSAVQSLMLDARTAFEAGNYSLAATYLERAGRIAPNNPYVWSAMAEVKLAQGEYAQAIQFVTLSDSLAAPQDQALQQKNRTIRAQAQQGLGQG